MTATETAVWTAVYAGVMSQSNWGSVADQQERALLAANRAVSDYRKVMKG